MSWSSIGAGSAPGWRKTMIPSRNAISVGIELIWSPPDRSRSSSVLMLPKTMSGLASDAAS